MFIEMASGVYSMKETMAEAWLFVNMVMRDNIMEEYHQPGEQDNESLYFDEPVQTRFIFCEDNNLLDFQFFHNNLSLTGRCSKVYIIMQRILINKNMVGSHYLTLTLTRTLALTLALTLILILSFQSFH